MRKLTNRKKEQRKDANYTAVKSIYDRATQGGSESYLAVNQPSDEDRVAKVKAQAEQRRQQRAARQNQVRERIAPPAPRAPKATRAAKVRGRRRHSG